MAMADSWSTITTDNDGGILWYCSTESMPSSAFSMPKTLNKVDYWLDIGKDGKLQMFEVLTEDDHLSELEELFEI